MNMIYALLIIVVGIVGSIGLYVYFHYKEKELEFQKISGKQNEEISIKALDLEIEKENTRQMELNASAFRDKCLAIKASGDSVKGKEETEQLRIKTNYREKYGDKLF